MQTLLPAEAFYWIDSTVYDHVWRVPGHARRVENLRSWSRRPLDPDARVRLKPRGAALATRRGDLRPVDRRQTRPTTPPVQPGAVDATPWHSTHCERLSDDATAGCMGRVRNCPIELRILSKPRVALCGEPRRVANRVYYSKLNTSER